jgi:hypothetical protein
VESAVRRADGHGIAAPMGRVQHTMFFGVCSGVCVCVRERERERVCVCVSLFAYTYGAIALPSAEALRVALRRATQCVVFVIPPARLGPCHALSRSLAPDTTASAAAALMLWSVSQEADACAEAVRSEAAALPSDQEVPLAYPARTPRVPLAYPSSTPRVPLAYFSRTPRHSAPC